MECKSAGSLRWKERFTVATLQKNLDEVERFDFYLDGAGHNAIIGSLTVMASAANNSSQIRCRVSDNLSVDFDVANLMVVGKLAITLSLERAWSLKQLFLVLLLSRSEKQEHFSAIISHQTIDSGLFYHILFIADLAIRTTA